MLTCNSDDAVVVAVVVNDIMLVDWRTAGNGHDENKTGGYFDCDSSEWVVFGWWASSIYILGYTVAASIVASEEPGTLEYGCDAFGGMTVSDGLG